jgi:hypothetical protein
VAQVDIGFGLIMLLGVIEAIGFGLIFEVGFIGFIEDIGIGLVMGAGLCANAAGVIASKPTATIVAANGIFTEGLSPSGA